MDGLNLLLTIIILVFILISFGFILRTYQLNKRLDQQFKLLNCGDSGQIFILRSVQMVLIIFFPIFILFDDLPNLSSILYLFMHLVLFIAQIYSTIYTSVGTKGLRVGIFSYSWEEVDRTDILTGLHEDNHKYPSGGVIRFFIDEKIYRAELKNDQIEELKTLLEKHVEIYTH